MKVELRPAHIWMCPECEGENFVNGIVPDCQETLRQQYGVPESEEGDFMLAPERVVCDYCEAEFETVNYRELDN